MQNLRKSDQIAIALEGLLREMEVGQRLPGEHVLARNLGCGRSTLRQVIQGFEQQGILERRQGAGTWLNRLPDQMPSEEMVELWPKSFSLLDRLGHGTWDRFDSMDTAVRLVDQEEGPAAWLPSTLLGTGAMRTSARPSLNYLDYPYFAEQADAGAAADLTDDCQSLPIFEKIEPWAWQLAQRKGRVMGVPVYASAMGIWLERDALDQIGLMDIMPTSWEQLTDMLCRLVSSTGKRLAMTPTSNAVNLLGTLTALAGGALQHDENELDAASNMQAVTKVVDWLNDLLHRQRIVDFSMTFGQTRYRRIQSKLLGFIHGLSALDQRWAKSDRLNRFAFIPFPPMSKEAACRYPMVIRLCMMNRHLAGDRLFDAFKLMDRLLDESFAQKRCEAGQHLSLTYRDIWQWPQRPNWLDANKPAWQQIMQHELTGLSSPAGLNESQTLSLWMRIVQGEFDTSVRDRTDLIVEALRGYRRGIVNDS